MAEIIFPNWPPRKDHAHYEYLASVGYSEEELQNSCIKVAEVTGIFSRSSVNVLCEGTTYTDIPVYIHTDIGCRVPFLKNVESEKPEDYFADSALFFPMPGEVLTMRGMTKVPSVFVAVHSSKEGQRVLFVSHVRETMFYSFEEDVLKLPNTWRMHALIEVSSPTKTFAEYSVYDMVNDSVASLPTYPLGTTVPELPLVDAYRLSITDADASIAPFIASGIQLPNTAPTRTAWHYIGVSIAPFGTIPSFTGLHEETGVSLLPYYGTVNYSPNGAEGIFEKDSLKAELQYYTPVPGNPLAITSGHKWSNVTMAEPWGSYIGAGPNPSYSHKSYYTDGSFRYFIREREYTLETTGTWPAITSKTVRERRREYIVSSMSEVLTSEMNEQDSFTVAEQYETPGSFIDYREDMQSRADTMVKVSAGFEWTGTLNMQTTLVRRTRYTTTGGTTVTENLGYKVIGTSSLGTDPGKLITDTTNLKSLIDDVYMSLATANPNNGITSKVSFHLVPYDVRAGIL